MTDNKVYGSLYCAGKFMDFCCDNPKWHLSAAIMKITDFDPESFDKLSAFFFFTAHIQMLHRSLTQDCVPSSVLSPLRSFGL